MNGREIGLFNLNGEYFALANRHAGGPLCDGRIVALEQSEGPGHYRLARQQEFLRCPWGESIEEDYLVIEPAG